MTITYVLFCLIFFVLLMIHQVYKPRLVEARQHLMIAILETTVAVAGGLAGNAVVQMFS
ncbi:hypothetical protein D3C75_1388300 [compost metagenome]